MEESNLEQQIERIKLAMDTYVHISQNKDKEKIIEKLQILNQLGIIDIKTLDEWLASYESNQRDDKTIREYVGYSIFSTLFKPEEKDKTEFLWSNIRLGLSLADVYNKEINGVKTSFFNEQTTDFRKYEDVKKERTSKERSPLGNILNLINKGSSHDLCLFPDYLGSQKHFKKALNLLSRKKLFKNQSILEDSLKKRISSHKWKYEKGIESYNEMKKCLEKQCPPDMLLSLQDYDDAYKKLIDFKDKTFNSIKEHGFLKNYIFGYHFYAIKDYCLSIVKTLKGKIPYGFDDTLSKFYVLHSILSNKTDKRKAYYLRKAIELCNNNLEAHYESAMYQEDKNNESQALMHWCDLIRFYFEKHEKIPLIKFKRSSNEVGKLEDKNIQPNYLFDKLLIKRSKGDISKEYNLMEKLYNLSSDKSRVPKPVAHIKHKDGYNYLVMRETTTAYNEKCDDVRSLSELFDYIGHLEDDLSAIEKLGLKSKKYVLDNFKAQYLKISLNNLIEFQEDSRALQFKEEKYDFKKTIEDKIFKRLGIKKENIGHFEFLVEQIDGQETCFSHGDFHSGNILIKGDNCTLIDFEYAGAMPILYDAIFLIEDPELDLGDSTKEELIKYYLEQKGISFDDTYKKNTDYMSLFTTLRWAGISSKWADITGEEQYNRARLTSPKKSKLLR